MAIVPIFNIIGNAFSGIIAFISPVKASLKSLGIFLTRYEADLKAAGEGDYDPESKKSSLWNSIPLINKLSENNQLRVKKVGDFLISPSFLQIVGLISIGSMFFSPLGPIAAAIGASISLTIVVSNFLYQSYKLKITTIRKENLKCLLSLEEQEKQLQKGIENGKITPEMQAFYKQNVSILADDFTPEVVEKKKFVKYIISDAASNFFTSSIIITSSILAFNIPSAVFGGAALLGNSIEKGARSKAELKSQYELKCKVANLSNKMKIPAGTNAKSLSNLHDANLKSRAFHLTCEQFNKLSGEKKFDNQAFAQTYNAILSEFRENVPAPKVSFWKAFSNNIIKGFSMHKGSQQHAPNLPKNYKESSKIERTIKVMRAKFVTSDVSLKKYGKSQTKQSSEDKNSYKDAKKESFREKVVKSRSSATKGKHIG